MTGRKLGSSPGIVKISQSAKFKFHINFLFHCKNVNVLTNGNITYIHIYICMCVFACVPEYTLKCIYTLTQHYMKVNSNPVYVHLNSNHHILLLSAYPPPSMEFRISINTSSKDVFYMFNFTSLLFV